MMMKAVRMPPFVATAQARWRGLAERERLMLGIGAAFLVALLLWWFALAPALPPLPSAPAQIELADGLLQQMQQQAAEVRELRAMPPVTLPQAQAALAAAVQRLGSKARHIPQGERAVVELNGVDGQTLGSWLAEVRLAARVKVVEAQLNRLPNGAYSGSVVLAHGARP